VLAAGLGTRLRPLTLHRPKPLVPVCGVPLLAYSLALCARHGVHRAIVNAHWLAPQLEAWQGEFEGVRVTVCTEQPDILGTGGGLKRVADQLARRFMVLNADVLHDVDLGALMQAVRLGGAAMALRPDPVNAPRYGIVASDRSQTVVQLTSLATAVPEGEVQRDTHFTGIHAMDRDALSLVPDGFACVVRSAYTDLVPRRLVGAVRALGFWLDAGDPAAYLDANMQVLDGGVRPALDPFTRAGFAIDGDGRVYGDVALVRGVAVQGPVWIGPGARLSPGSRVQRSVVGAGAVVPSGSAVINSVVWSNAEVPRALAAGSVVHDGGVWAPAT